MTREVDTGIAVTTFPIVPGSRTIHADGMIVHDGIYRPDGIDAGPALTKLKEQITALYAENVRATIENQFEPAYSFAGFVLAALELSDRKPIPQKEVVELAARALDCRDQSKLTTGDNKCCELMLRMALLNAKVWNTVQDHFHDTLAMKGRFDEFSAELHDVFEISRRMKHKTTWQPKNKQHGKEPFYQLGKINISLGED